LSSAPQFCDDGAYKCPPGTSLLNCPI
jgi:hypothetical protein